MAGKVRFLLERDGRYFARIVVPKDLRAAVGKTELRAALGGDRRSALKHLPAAVTRLQMVISDAEQQVRQSKVPARYPMEPHEMASAHYTDRLAFDDELRNYPGYATVMVDDVLVHRLRAAIAGRSNDGELIDLVGPQLQRFARAGNFDAKPGSDLWRTVARGLCSAELEALERVCERDQGDFTGKPTAPILKAVAADEPVAKKLSMRQLWKDYVEMRQQAGFMRSGGNRQGAVIESLRKFVKHDDARRVTKQDVIAWRDHLMKTLSAKTVADVYLSTARTMFNYACENDLLEVNPAEKVRQQKPKKQHSRERGYTDAEALKVLKAAWAYKPNADATGYVREKPQYCVAKKWVPFLAAYSGARISELTQLRKCDVHQIDGIWCIRIQPDAGSVKAGHYRDVPLHRHLIDLGFLTFVEGNKDGPLFTSAQRPEDYVTASKTASDRIRFWIRDAGLRPDGVQPNHAWRHKFKTMAMELEIPQRVADAIQGHAGRTASDDYGDVRIGLKKAAIDKLPAYDLAA